MLLLQRFKLLCVAGLEAEGNPLEGGAETTLIRCNCCYNLPVGSGMSNVRDPLGWPYTSMFFLCLVCLGNGAVLRLCPLPVRALPIFF